MEPVKESNLDIIEEIGREKEILREENKKLRIKIESLTKALIDNVFTTRKMLELIDEKYKFYGED